MTTPDARGTTLRVYLVDGTPQGLRWAEVPRDLGPERFMVCATAMAGARLPAARASW